MKDEKKNPEVYLEDILECIRVIEGYIHGKNEEAFATNLQLQDAVVRRLEIIGEAVKNLPSKIKEKHPGIPWKDIAGTRDFLIHNYDNVQIQIVWNILQHDLQKLKNTATEILEGLMG